MQKRLREAREESLLRSVGRANGRGNRRWARLLPWRSRANTESNGHGSPNGNGNGKLRRGHAEIDFHDRGEDVWKALRF